MAREPRTFAVVESDGRAALADVSRHEGVEPVLPRARELVEPEKLKRYADVLPKLCPAGPAERRARADALRPREVTAGRGKGAKPKRAAAPETNLKRLAKLSEKLAWRF